MQTPRNALEECEELRRRSLEWFTHYQETGKIDGKAILEVAAVAEISYKPAD